VENYDLDALQEQIDIVEYIGRYVDLEYKNGEWWGMCPFHSENTASFSVNENTKLFYCFGCGEGGNIFDFIIKKDKISFRQALTTLVNQFGGSLSQISAILRVLKKYQPKNKNVSENRIILPSEIMGNYDEGLIQEWVDEGISPEILNKYQVKYDNYHQRITFPIWDNEGNIIAISGRTIDPQWKQKDLRKYTYYNKIGVLDFLYGFYQNKDACVNKNEVILFEGAKSVMKSETFGFSNAMSILTSNIGEQQRKALIKLPFKNLVVALDKEISIKEIKESFKQLKMYKNIYVIEDREGLLEHKMSPVDNGKEVWEELYNNKKIL
jgi:DNA primase